MSRETREGQIATGGVAKLAVEMHKRGKNTMSSVREQYEAYPYPERDPKDEAKRLIMGSPSQPVEIDHCLFEGRRDWSGTFRALVAGGGTGDGLIMLAQLLTGAGKDYDITYIDLSEASRAIAEARAEARGLKGITFVTGSLLDAASMGPFDYIDCVGVLHHLPEPQAGFDALAAAVSPEGGIGMMVYAPLGRSGVYPLQKAFGELFDGMSPKDRLKAGKSVFERVPEGHPFKRNPRLVDHKQSDAGFYDLLLHSQDRAYTVPELTETLAAAGLGITSFTEPGAYELATYLPPGVHPPKSLDVTARRGLAENLSGCMSRHALYVAPEARAGKAVAKWEKDAVPHLRAGVPVERLAEGIEQGRRLNLKTSQGQRPFVLPRQSAKALKAIDGRRTIAEIAAETGLAPSAFEKVWKAIEEGFVDWGLVHYSRILSE
ncbi:MAG: class I SAM-dependent methyltransferase [Pseudomonadota bacterium]